MFFPNCMKSTQQAVFDIAQHGVDPFETRVLGALSTSTGHYGARLSHTHETCEPIGEDVTASHQAGLGVASDFALTKAPHATQLSLHGAAILRRLNSRGERDLVGRSAPAFTGFLATQIRIIHFNATAQRFPSPALHHHRHQLVFNCPRGVVVHPNFTGALPRRGAFLTLRQPIDGKKPLFQRRLGAVKDSSGSQGSLMVTLVARVYRTLFELTARGIAAFRANISARPGQCVQGLPALLFRCVFFKKLVQSETFFEIEWCFSP